MSRVEATPTEGLCYNPTDPLYWDEEGLKMEMERVLDICVGCRMCFKYCPTFPALFELVDRPEVDGDVRKLSEPEVEHVVDLCYQCKICYVACPYTPDDGHEFQLDFPRLFQRYTAQRQKKLGTPLNRKLLANPDFAGTMASFTPKLANWANNTSFHRKIMQTMLGIHKDKDLPKFHGETFEKWWTKHWPEFDKTPQNGRVVLFYTCFVNYNNPGLGKDAVKVLDRNKVGVHCPSQNCCGMPALEAGDIPFAQKQARQNVENLLPWVRKGYKVLAINPTCSYTIRKEYGELLNTPEAREVAENTMDLMEYLETLKRDDKLDRDFKKSPGTVAYHVPCHLRAQNIGLKSRDVMKVIPGAKVKPVTECCGHDGTWAMRKENFELSLKAGEKAFDGLKQAGGDTCVTDCPLAAIQINQATGTFPIHPVQVLARAYEGDLPKDLPKEES